MKNKKIRWFVLFVFAFLFLGTSCSSNSYDGDMCGVATVDGTNEFSQIRRYYVAEFEAELYEYEFNKTDLYVTKANYVAENNIIRERTEEEITSGLHGRYLFVINSENRVINEDKSYVPAEKVANYIASVNEVTYDATTNTFSGEEANVTKANEDLNHLQVLTTRYEKHVSSTTYDINDKSSKAAEGNIVDVKTRLTNHSKACIVFGESITDPQTGVLISSKSWGEAFTEGGFLTGLIVYPVSWVLNLFVGWFGSTGTAQVFAIVLTTFILKILIMLLTFKSTMSTHKMQNIQPEIAALQAKYGQNPTPEQRNRMGMEMMAIYNKYGVKPFAPFVSMLVTFPVFIAMYQAVIQTTVLRTGSFLGIILGEKISSHILTDFKWGALAIFLTMALTQILSMKLPQIINKKRMTEAAKKAQKQSSTMTYIFMIMILFMGFTMPATMSVYWIASSIVSVAQTLIMHKINGTKGKKGKKYKVKKVEKKYTIPQGKIVDR